MTLMSDDDSIIILSLLLLSLRPVLETKDKPQISYSEIRGYSEVYPPAEFWHFSNIFILGVTILGITWRCL